MPVTTDKLKVEFCSGCIARTTHRSVVESGRRLRRRRFRCESCGATTSQCSTPGCRYMTVAPEAGRGDDRDSRSKPRLFCAEHGGEIPSFSKADLRFSDLGDWNDFFARDSRDVRKLGKSILVALAVGGGAGAVVVPVAGVLAAKLGAMGLLGAASTGTAIQSLSGAALAKASLAYLGGGALAAGGGGMAVGTGVVGAAGAVLGTARGVQVANAYYGEVKGYEIKNVRRSLDHGRPPLLFVDGFLQDEEGRFDDWDRGTRVLFPGSAAYGVKWESGRLAQLGGVLQGSAKAVAAFRRKPRLKAAAVLGLQAVLDNPWHVALYKANGVGVMNADMVSRFDGAPPVLMGHSLGARTIYYSLLQLVEKGGPPKVQDVFLLGGAVGRAAEWDKAASAVAGTIWNLYSERDQVLSKLYRVATAGLSEPVGTGPIASDAANVVDIDCSDVVGSHGEFKEKLGDLLGRADFPREGGVPPGARRLLRALKRGWVRLRDSFCGG